MAATQSTRSTLARAPRVAGHQCRLVAVRDAVGHAWPVMDVGFGPRRGHARPYTGAVFCMRRKIDYPPEVVV